MAFGAARRRREGEGGGPNLIGSGSLSGSSSAVVQRVGNKTTAECTERLFALGHERFGVAALITDLQTAPLMTETWSREVICPSPVSTYSPVSLSRD